MKSESNKEQFTDWRVFFVEHGILATAALCLLLTIFLTFVDQIAGAALLATLFVILFLFWYLPRTDILKAVSIEIKLRERLIELGEVIQKVKQIAIASGRLNYYLLGLLDRTDAVPPEIQRIANEVDAALRELGFGPEQLLEMKTDYLNCRTGRVSDEPSRVLSEPAGR